MYAVGDWCLPRFRFKVYWASRICDYYKNVNLFDFWYLCLIGWHGDSVRLKSTCVIFCFLCFSASFQASFRFLAWKWWYFHRNLVIGIWSSFCWLIRSQNHRYLAIGPAFPFLWWVFCSCCWIVWLASILRKFYGVCRSFRPMCNSDIVRVYWSYRQRPSPLLPSVLPLWISWLIGFFPSILSCFQWSVWIDSCLVHCCCFPASFQTTCSWSGYHGLWFRSLWICCQGHWFVHRFLSF